MDDAVIIKFPFASKFNLGIAKVVSVVSTFFCACPTWQMASNKIAIEYFMFFYLRVCKIMSAARKKFSGTKYFTAAL